MEMYWKKAKVSIRTKLLVYEAIIHSKLLYGITSANLTDGVLEELDVFQRKGRRQIMKLPTTFGQMQANRARSTHKRQNTSASKRKNKHLGEREK